MYDYRQHFYGSDYFLNSKERRIVLKNAYI